ncbi:MAG: hypothetical protein JRG74_01330 [Deltaproteobacteria bacterium]|nr:hypothetical protein [Deltaproteobacteria bacterium]
MIKKWLAQKRHYIPGHVWHITHRCHKREYLLKFPRDRRSKTFIEKIKEALRFRAQVRKIISSDDTFELREGQTSYGDANRLDSGNTFLWDQPPPSLIGQF